MDKEKKTIVRFAPSPTGHLHIGGARTALFNYLFAKKKRGIFILRIEDTDRERSSPEMSEEIMESLQWLGIKWDKGPYFQSEREELYKKLARKLLDTGKAYRCFCTREEIKKRSVVDGETVNYMYDRFCLNLSESEVEKKLAEKIPYVIRFKVPEGITKFKDRIHKELSTNNGEIEDFILIRSDGKPTYQLSVVADDIDMGITDVIRGDDHISNTFKQIMLFNALRTGPPKYTHLPLVFGKDKKKLSKRHGEVSVLEFRRKGYLPEALVTYFSQLSWNPGDTSRVFSLEDLIEKFDFSKVSKNSPVFDFDKLLFLNSRAIRSSDPERLLKIMSREEDFQRQFKTVDKKRLSRLIELVKPRIKLLKDFKYHFRKYLFADFTYGGVEFKNLDIKKGGIKNIELLIKNILEIEDFTPENVETVLRKCAKEQGLNAKELIHPSRYALTGMNVSPPIFDVFDFLGKEESVKRLKKFLNFLKNNVFSH